jgi:hypothetical protein
MSQKELKLFKCMYHWKDQVARELNEWRDDICNLNNLIKMCKTRVVSNYVKFNDKISMTRKDELMKMFSKYNLGEIKDISTNSDIDTTEKDKTNSDDNMEVDIEREFGTIVCSVSSEKPCSSKSMLTTSTAKPTEYELDEISEDELDDITITVMYDTTNSKPADFEEISEEEMEDLTVKIVNDEQHNQINNNDNEEILEINAPDELLTLNTMCLRCFDIGHPVRLCPFPNKPQQEEWMKDKVKMNKEMRQLTHSEYFRRKRAKKNKMYKKNLNKKTSRGGCP